MYKRLMLVLLLAFLLIPSAAFAQEEPHTPRSLITISGKMVVDCNSLSSEGLEYVRGYDLCLDTFGPGVSGSGFNQPGFVTDGSASNTGDCGTVTLTINNDTTIQGNASITVNVSSSIGIMTSVSYSVPWTNLNTLYSNTTTGGASIGLGTTYNNTKSVFTGAGLVAGVLTGWAQVNLFVRCNFIPTATSGNIS